MHRQMLLAVVASTCLASLVIAASTHQRPFVLTPGNDTPEYHNTAPVESLDAEQDPTAILPYTGVRLMYQNDLDWRRIVPGHLLLDETGSYAQQSSRCSRMGETLARDATLKNNAAEIDKQLRYLAYASPKHFDTSSTRRFWISNQRLLVRTTSGAIEYRSNQTVTGKYYALCSQSAARSRYDQPRSNRTYHIQASHGGLKWNGTRDALSFRFLTLPYAKKPTRFEYSSPYPESNITIDATATDPSRRCTQDGRGIENCLFMSIFTSHLPSDENRIAKRGLKPVLLWIHGGYLKIGSGPNDATFDGGQLASRADIVVATINYRLGSLGFLAANAQIPGNFGLSDIISALHFLRKYAASFGGDPDRITIAGQSSGAQLVNALLGSPEAKGLFVGAIAMSPRPADEFNRFRNRTTLHDDAVNVIKAVGCDSSASNAALLTCLRNVRPQDFSAVGKPVFNRIVHDDKYITYPKLGVTKGRRERGAFVNKVPVIYGFMRDEMASLGTVPPISEKNLSRALAAASVPAKYIRIVTDPKNKAIFPVPSGSNGIQNLSVTIETNIDSVARCGQESTISAAVNSSTFTSLWAYTMDRAWQPDNFPGVSCMGSTSSTNPSRAYLCHSGDLYAVFATPNYEFGRNPRDDQDLRWMRNTADQFGSFVTRGDPRPPKAYMTARGYGAQEIAMGGSEAWDPVTENNPKIIQIGPRQSLVTLRRDGKQCDALDRDIAYVARGE